MTNPLFFPRQGGEIIGTVEKLKKERTKVISETKTALDALKPKANNVLDEKAKTEAMQKFTENLAQLYKLYNGDIPPEVEVDILSSVEKDTALKAEITLMLNQTVDANKDVATLAEELGDSPPPSSIGNTIWGYLSFLDNIIDQSGLKEKTDKDGKVTIQPDQLSAFLTFAKIFLMKQFASVAESIGMTDASADIRWEAEWQGRSGKQREELEKRDGGVKKVRDQWQVKYNEWLLLKKNASDPQTFKTPCPTIDSVIGSAKPEKPAEAATTNPSEREITGEKMNVTVNKQNLEFSYDKYGQKNEQLKVSLDGKKYKILLKRKNGKVISRPYAYLTNDGKGKQGLKFTDDEKIITECTMEDVLEALHKTIGVKKIDKGSVTITFEPEKSSS